MPADAGIRFGQYILVRRIARGGMAEVFLAQQRGLEGFDRRVAVKRILPHLADSSDFVKMFFGEAKLAAQLAHPNVVHIYEFGKVDQDYFIAMEFVDGVHAGQLFKHGEREKLPAALVARLGADAANALHYAHELRGANGKSYGLVHRDVSPANIMISYDGIVKLCDFGIAKAVAVGDQLTNPGQVKGKYAYMSPEQTVAAQLDGRSDVFALAIVLWELLTGKYIVPRGDAVAAMRAIRDGKLEPIDKAAPGVPRPLAKAISWALEPKRDNRATAADFAEALEAFIKSSPELATSMQLGRWVRDRFPREGTGQHPPLPADNASPGTHVAPGTMAAPGTSGEVHDLQSADISEIPVRLTPYPQRRVVKLLMDTAEGTEIYTTSDIEDSATVKGPRPEPPISSASDAATVLLRTSNVLARTSNVIVDEATVHGRPPALVGDETEVVDPRHMPAMLGADGTDDEDSQQHELETVLRDNRVPISSGPAIVPTRLQQPLVKSAVPAASPGALTVAPAAAVTVVAPGAKAAAGQGVVPVAPPGAPTVTPISQSDLHAAQPISGAFPQPLGSQGRTTGTLRGTGTRGIVQRPASDPASHRRRSTLTAPDAARERRKKMILTGSALAGLMLLSFMIALAVSNTGSRRGGAPQDADVVIMTPIDAALPIAPPPLDAALQPTVAIDAAVEATTGQLLIRTIPAGGTISVGGHTRIATNDAPALLVLEAGRHTVEAQLAGYKPETREVVLERGDSKTIEITLMKTEVRPGTPMGRLSVRTIPWSDVYLGPNKLGQAPFEDVALPAGTHTLTFRNPSRPVVTKSVTIKPNKVTKLNFNLP